MLAVAQYQLFNIVCNTLHTTSEGEVVTNPPIIGRQEYDDSLDNRAATELVHKASIAYEAGAVGKLEVETFKSVDSEDRGGLVLRITIQDQGSSFIPYAKNIPSGVELHMAGDVEGESLVDALKEALSTL